MRSSGRGGCTLRPSLGYVPAVHRLTGSPRETSWGPSEQEAPIGWDIWSLLSRLATEDSPFLL